jgi:hypothetical protein
VHLSNSHYIDLSRLVAMGNMPGEKMFQRSMGNGRRTIFLGFFFFFSPFSVNMLICLLLQAL